MTLAAEERQVRTLRLSAPSEALVQRGVILLEDALRTATFPETSGSRLLVLRSLSVGTIHSHLSAANLALNIERRLTHLGTSAVYALTPGACHHAAVYFHDEVEPYFTLAVKLAKGESPDDWFWTLAVTTWQPDQPRDEALRTLLTGVMRTRAGTTAAVKLLHILHTQHCLDPLLSSLRWVDGEKLMFSSEWTRPSTPMAQVTLTHIGYDARAPRGWNEVLLRWVERWGLEDPRSVWLACMVLAAEKPGRLLDRGLPSRGDALLRTVGNSIRTSQLHAPLQRVETESTLRPSQSSPLTPYDMSAEAAPPQRISEKSKKIASRTRDVPRVSDREDTGSLLRKNPSSPNSIETISTKQKDVIGDSTTKVVREITSWLKAPHKTSYAGVFFLVPVLSRLGMEEFLKEFPHWIEHDLPARLFLEVCKHLDVPEEDPIRALLPVVQDEGDCTRFDFFAPQCWEERIMGKGALVYQGVKDAGGLRILSDSTNRLTLGLWHGKMPTGVRDLVGKRNLIRGAWLTHEPEIEIVSRAWLTATRRWCRRFARIGLRELVSRPGQISVTRTHMDVVLDNCQAEIRIRKAGLDFDPGWVPWLSRVVHFHYLDGESIDGE